MILGVKTIYGGSGLGTGLFTHRFAPGTEFPSEHYANRNTNLLIVTTPQASASHVAGRVGFLANEVDVHILGVIENMSYFQCSNCGEKYKIFGEGETEELAIRLNTSILGRIPLITEIREKSVEGNPTTLSGGAGEKIFQEVTDEIIKEVKNRYKLVHG